MVIDLRVITKNPKNVFEISKLNEKLGSAKFAHTAAKNKENSVIQKFLTTALEKNGK